MISVGNKAFGINYKEVNNICAETVTQRFKSTYCAHIITFLFWLFDNMYADLCLQKGLVKDLTKSQQECKWTGEK